MRLFNRKSKQEREKLDFSKPIKVPEIVKVAEGKRYSSLDANCIAQGIWFGGILYCWLMQTNKNNFFLVGQNIGDGELIGPATVGTVQTLEDAIKFYEQLTLQIVPFETVFEGKRIIDA